MAHVACKALHASWTELLEQRKGEMTESEMSAYEERLTLKKSPKFQMVTHLVKQAFADDASILVFSGAGPCASARSSTDYIVGIIAF